jgi:hypothetical protein
MLRFPTISVRFGGVFIAAGFVTSAATAGLGAMPVRGVVQVPAAQPVPAFDADYDRAIDADAALSPQERAACHASTTVCIKQGHDASHGWYLPQCANDPCGVERWYTSGLPRGVSASFDPATTRHAQETIEKLRATSTAPPGTYSATIGANCNGGYCGSGTYRIVVIRSDS